MYLSWVATLSSTIKEPTMWETVITLSLQWHLWRFIFIAWLHSASMDPHLRARGSPYLASQHARMNTIKLNQSVSKSPFLSAKGQNNGCAPCTESLSSPLLLLHDNSNPANHVPVESRLHFSNTLELRVNHPNGVPIWRCQHVCGRKPGIWEVNTDKSGKW